VGVRNLAPGELDQQKKRRSVHRKQRELNSLRRGRVFLKFLAESKKEVYPFTSN